MLTGAYESLSNQLSDAGIKSAAQVAAWNHMQSDYINSNAQTVKTVAQVKSIIQAVAIGKATGLTPTKVLSSPTGLAIKSTNLTFQGGQAKQTAARALEDRGILTDLNKGALSDAQLADVTGKYIDLTTNPPTTPLFDFGPLFNFGDLGKYLPYVLIGGAALVLLMVVKKK